MQHVMREWEPLFLLKTYRPRSVVRGTSFGCVSVSLCVSVCMRACKCHSLCTRRHSKQTYVYLCCQPTCHLCIPDPSQKKNKTLQNLLSVFLYARLCLCVCVRLTCPLPGRANPVPCDEPCGSRSSSRHQFACGKNDRAAGP